MSTRASEVAVWRRIADAIFWGITGAMSGGAYGSLMGAMGGLIVGGAIGIVKVGWTILDATIVRGDRLSFADVLEMSGEVIVFAFGGVRIGAFILGSLFGVSYSIYLAYVMDDYNTRRSNIL